MQIQTYQAKTDTGVYLVTAPSRTLALLNLRSAVRDTLHSLAVAAKKQHDGETIQLNPYVSLVVPAASDDRDQT
tara:strand:- start:747 stop:968 length:222 start_codon:yes stop_codon:yes gene_type:complete